MSGSEPPGAGEGFDEFDLIARLLRPLAEGAPEALGLMDDAAVIASRPGFDLVVTKDAVVEGVHFLPDDPLDLVARNLLRVNLSDLAAKGAEPYGYFLACAWPRSVSWAGLKLFAEGLRQDQDAFGLKLMGGDTVSTPGPLTLSATLLGWVPEGRMVKRSGAKPGDLVLVSGTIGDGWLGLKAARGEALGLDAEQIAWLADRYRLPQPRLSLGPALRQHAHAAADISDGLVADAGHIAEASGVAITLDLDLMPLSLSVRAWVTDQADEGAALIALATGGDDYEIVCAATAPDADRLVAAGMMVVGLVSAGQGVCVLHKGRPLELSRTGWRHG